MFWIDGEQQSGRVKSAGIGSGVHADEIRIREIVREEISAFVFGNFMEDTVLAAWEFGRGTVSPASGPRAHAGDGESGSVETTPGPDSPATDYSRMAIAVALQLPAYCEGLRFDVIAGVLEAADKAGLFTRVKFDQWNRWDCDAGLIAAALGADYTAPRAMDWPERVLTVKNVMAAVSAVHQARFEGHLS